MRSYVLCNNVDSVTHMDCLDMIKIAITPEFDIDESDLNDLAWSWYFTTQEIEYISAKNALAILNAIIGAYLRGCGIRMGNHQGFDKHSDKKILLMVQVLTEAVERYPEAKRFKEAYQNITLGQGRDIG